MADLGSLANLITDINAKVTTNGVQENTGSRVNESMRNMADTLANLPALVEFAETWRFLTDTTDTDPGSGFFQVNNATVASVTELYISRTSHSGADLDAWINNWPGAGVLALFGDDPANALIFIVSSISPWSGYYKMTLTYGSGTIPGAGDVFRFVFITSAAGGSTAFADITGDPSDNTLLDAALNAKQDSDAELSAIAGLTSAADKVPYFTGSGTAALTDLTSAARTVLDDTTVSAMVDTLGGASATGTGGIVRASAPTMTNPVVGTQTAGDNSTKAASTAYVAAAVAAAVAGLLEFQGPVDCSANPNYPAALKGDTYYVSVAGKIGGASGISVDIGDAVIASADNAGGTQASVGTSWFILEHNLAGALLSANNLSDLTNAGTARTNLGLGTAAESDTGDFDAAGAAAAAQAASQPLDSDLTAIAGISPSNDDVVQRKAGAWTNRSMSQLKTDLVLVKADVGLGSVTNDAQLKIASNLSDVASRPTSQKNLTGTTVVAMSADQSVTSTSAVAITDLVFAGLASEVYDIDVYASLEIDNATGQFGVSIIVPAGATIHGTRTNNLSAGTTQQRAIDSSGGGGLGTAIGAANTVVGLMINVKVIMDTTPGYIQVVGAVNNASYTGKLKAKSTMYVTKVLV
jgi:hypothetical protein